jgi:hypothetical protein
VEEVASATLPNPSTIRNGPQASGGPPISTMNSGTVTASITNRNSRLKSSFPNAIAAGAATRRSSVSVWL